MKKIIISLIIVLAVIAAFFAFQAQDSSTPDSEKSYKDISYTIEGQAIQLVNGISEIESIPGSAAKITTRYFGNEIMHDLNDDGQEDVVFLLTQERGGSGVFFYAVAALKTPTGYIGSDAFLLGDRIAPQTINIDEGTTVRGTSRENVIVINYATRNPDEPLTAKPTVGKSVWIKLDPTTLQFGEVAQWFEGENR